MLRRVILPGLLGGLVMVVWAFVINGIFGFQARIDMNRVPNEGRVYEVLKQNITEPGRYVCNPAVTEDGPFPGSEPVFGILYGGMGHEAAGAMMLVKLPLFFIPPILAVWMLTWARPDYLSSLGRKVLFFAVVGLMIAIADHLMDFGIGSYPAISAILLSVHDVALWTVAGLVMAWSIKPENAHDRPGRDSA